MRGMKMMVAAATRDRVKTTLASHGVMLVMHDASVLATARARESGMRVDAFAL
jgi:hypothetical protein